MLRTKYLKSMSLMLIIPRSCIRARFTGPWSFIFNFSVLTLFIPKPILSQRISKVGLYEYILCIDVILINVTRNWDMWGFAFYFVNASGLERLVICNGISSFARLTMIENRGIVRFLAGLMIEMSRLSL